jgi:thiamine-monophosphate kinase
MKSPFRSEAEFVAWIRRRTPNQASGLALGIGDDAALIDAPRGQELILTTDMSIENVHFKTPMHPPRAVGHRALARSLSDIAAMGGTPRYALLSLAISRSTDRAWLASFFKGFFTLARKFSVAVIGGDTAFIQGPTTADVIVVGLVPKGEARRRSDAKVGDHIFVSGRLGMSALGLELLRSTRGRPKRAQPSAIRAHLYPQPQCGLGRFLSQHHLANALMDLSDGLSIDLRRLCDASNVGARVFAGAIPSPTGMDCKASLNLALHGGEDYQLLFTVPKAKAAKIPSRFGRNTLTSIGEIVRERTIQIETPDGSIRPLAPEGYDHFRRSK